MKRITFFLLFLALWLPSALFAKYCTVCLRSVENSNYLTDGKNVFCSERCARIWEDKHAPKCAVCGKSVREGFQCDNHYFCSRSCIEKWEMRNAKTCYICGRKSNSGITSKGKFFCSEECFQKSLPVCKICHQPVTAGVRIGENDVYCKKCAAMEKCSVCDLPCGHASPQPDGRKICDKCLSTAIVSEEEALREFNDVRRALGRYFNLQIDDKVEFHLCGIDEISDRTKSRGTHEFGLCTYHLSTLMRGNVEIKSTEKRDIYILYGLPRSLFRAVAAHELAHDWYNCNVGQSPPLVIGEGWAQFVAWNYCKRIGDTEQMREIENNTVPAYRDGLRKMKRKLNISSGPEKLRAQLLYMAK